MSQRHDLLGLWSGAMLMGFVVIQIVYIAIDMAVLDAPSPDSPIVEFRELARKHAGILRPLILLPMVSFLGLFMPGVIGLRQRLIATPGVASPLADLAVVGALLIVVTLFFTLSTLAVLALVPEAELSDSVLRTMVMANTYSTWVAGGFASALFLSATSAAMLSTEPSPRMLPAAGLAAAALALVGELWLLNGDFDSPFFGLAMLSRAAFLVWIAATGVWLQLTAVATAAADPRTAAPG